MVKNCEREFENATRGRRPRAAVPHRNTGHSSSPYRPTLSRQITCLFSFLFSCSKMDLRIETGGTLSTNDL